MTKTAGHCSKCDKPVFEIRNQPGRTYVGHPAADALCVSLLMLDGSTADVTVCEACLHTLYEDSLPGFWNEVILPAFAEEGSNPDFWSFMSENPPLGVLYVRPWSEVTDDALIWKY